MAVDGTKYRTDYSKKLSAQGVMDVYEAAPEAQHFMHRMVRWALEQGAKPKAKLAEDAAAKVKPARDRLKFSKAKNDEQPSA